MPKTTGQLREEARYGGNPGPGGSRQAFARKSIDLSETPDDTSMKDAVKDTATVLRQSAQQRSDLIANQAMKKQASQKGLKKK